MSTHSPTPYPIPDHAAHIWTRGAELILLLPPSKGRKGHSVTLPNTPKGLASVLLILRERENSNDRRIGTKAAPVQHTIDAWLESATTDFLKTKKAKDQFSDEQKAKAKDIVSKLLKGDL